MEKFRPEEQIWRRHERRLSQKQDQIAAPPSGALTAREPSDSQETLALLDAAKKFPSLTPLALRSAALNPTKPLLESSKKSAFGSSFLNMLYPYRLRLSLAAFVVTGTVIWRKALSFKKRSKVRKPSLKVQSHAAQ